MSESPSESPQSFQARLAAMDRKLRQIQGELDPDREPRVLRPAVAPEPGFAPASGPGPAPGSAPAPDPPADRIPPAPPPPPPAWTPRREHPAPDPTTRLYPHLIASMRELLDGYESVLAHPAGSAGATVVAGPFSTTEAVREFERALRALPRVGEVSVRGYEAGDRAVIEVLFDQPNT